MRLYKVNKKKKNEINLWHTDLIVGTNISFDEENKLCQKQKQKKKREETNRKWSKRNNLAYFFLAFCLSIVAVSISMPLMMSRNE